MIETASIELSVRLRAIDPVMFKRSWDWFAGRVANLQRKDDRGALSFEGMETLERYEDALLAMDFLAEALAADGRPIR